MKYKKPNKEERTVFCIICENAENKCLHDHLNTYGKFDESVARYFFKQILDGMMHLQESEISHRDIKPENILLTNDLRVKIADFGFAKT